MTSAKTPSAVLLIVAPLSFTLAFTLLQMGFDYPGILRHDTAEILTRFAAGGTTLLIEWYLLMASALLLVPVAALLPQALGVADTALGRLAKVFGVIAGIMQGLGLMRWVILVPVLASTYVDPAASEAQRTAVATVFSAFHTYVGVGVGEHFGYLFTALWTLTLAAILWNGHRFLAIAGVLIALGVAAGLFEPFGVAAAGMVNTIAFTLWALWLVVFGVVLWRKRA